MYSLEEVIELSFRLLKPNGYFCFSVESDETIEGFRLRSTGRFAHATSYIQGIIGKYSFEVAQEKDIVVRKESNEPVLGKLFCLRKTE